MFTHFFYRQRIIAIVLVLILGWVALHTPIYQQKHYKTTQIQYTPAFFKLITAGYWPAAVEGMWITTLQQIAESTNPTLTAQFYDLATDLDPLFYEMYEQAGIYFSYYEHDAPRAIHFLQKGVQAYESKITTTSEKFRSRFWNHPSTLYIYLGYCQAFLAHDWPAAKATFLKGAEVPGTPRYLITMKEWLQKEGSEKILARKILLALINQATDPVIKANYEEQLKLYPENGVR